MKKIWLMAAIFYNSAMDTEKVALAQNQITRCTSFERLTPLFVDQIECIWTLINRLDIDSRDLYFFPRFKNGVFDVDFKEMSKTDVKKNWENIFSYLMREAFSSQSKKEFMAQNLPVITHVLSTFLFLKHEGSSEAIKNFRDIKKQLIHNWEAMAGVLPYIDPQLKREKTAGEKKLPNLVKVCYH